MYLTLWKFATLKIIALFRCVGINAPCVEVQIVPSSLDSFAVYRSLYFQFIRDFK